MPADSGLWRIMAKPYKKKHTGYKIKGKKSVCYIYQGSLDKDGYGIGLNRDTHLGETRFHRYMYRKHKGPIPHDCEIHHKCETKSCGRPLHLKAVTDLQHASLTKKLDPTFHDRRVAKVKQAFERDVNIHKDFRKLSDKKVIKIRRLFKQGQNYFEIARTIGCERASIRLICLGRTYKHLL